MALKKHVSLMSNFGIEVDVGEAYIKVTQLVASKESITANVGFFNIEKNQLFQTLPFTFKTDLNGGNFIAQSYDHLKTLSEFADAVDC